MTRESMRRELTLATLLYIKQRVLRNKKRFATKYSFVDKDGNQLPPSAASIPEAVQRNIAGAVIEALVQLDIDEDASESSKDFRAVIHHLGESIRDDFMNGEFKPKLEAVLQLNDEQGYEGVLKLVDATATRLFQDLMQNK